MYLRCTRFTLQRKFELQIYEKSNKTEIWNIFKQHHYLSAELNVACKMFVAYLNDNIVGMCAVLPQPSGCYENAWRIHRLVILPDYQGLGIGVKLLEYVCDLFKYHDKTMYLRTSHTKLINYMLKSKKWFGDGKMKYSQQETGMLKNKKIYTNRQSASFKYIADCEYVENKNYKSQQFKIKEKTNEIQLDLFDFIGDD